MDLDAPLLKLSSHDLRGAVLLESQLWMRMKVTPDAADLGFELDDRFEQVHEERAQPCGAPM